jgi:hypothetical protein
MMAKTLQIGGVFAFLGLRSEMPADLKLLLMDTLAPCCRARNQALQLLPNAQIGKSWVVERRFERGEDHP